jgi:predicted transcriptional regulator of viral defense system
VSGRLNSVRRGLYAHTTFVDPYLLASKLADDVVISHDGALSFHGLTGLGHRVSFMTSSRTPPVTYGEIIYQPIRMQRPFMRLPDEVSQREEQAILVTPIPATLVDCLALLDRGPPLDELMEIFKSLVKTADPSKMIAHARSYKSPLLIARLAYFLTCARYDLKVPDLQALNSGIPKQPTHFLRSARGEFDSAIRKWNLIVPPELYAFWPGNG